MKQDSTVEDLLKAVKKLERNVYKYRKYTKKYRHEVKELKREQNRMTLVIERNQNRGITNSDNINKIREASYA